MWKKILLFLACFVFCVGIGFTLQAEEEPTTEVEEELTEEALMDKVKNFMNQYSEESYVYQIINWLIDTGVLSALFFVVVKYNKYKNKTVDEVIGALGDNFEGLAKTQLDGLVKELEKLKESQELIMKVLILMQDSSPQGKIALLEFLGVKNGNLQEEIQQVEQEIQEQQATAEEVNSAVAENYERIRF